MAKAYDPIMCMMVDKPDKAQDESYVVRGKKYKVVKRDGDNVTVLGPDGKVTKMDIDFLMSEGVKTKDKLAKVPDSKLKDFEANLRSAGFKVVSKSDRGMTTHYQVEVSSGKTFTEADLREWANKIDSVCDKMDSVAPTTWNIGLTADGKITAGLDVREMYVKDSASALDKAIKVCDASTGHKVVVFVENYLRSIGKNNSTGKYDRIVQGVRSLLSQSLLDDEGLKKAAEHEADRLLKKYNL